LAIPATQTNGVANKMVPTLGGSNRARTCTLLRIGYSDSIGGQAISGVPEHGSLTARWHFEWREGSWRCGDRTFAVRRCFGQAVRGKECIRGAHSNCDIWTTAPSVVVQSVRGTSPEPKKAVGQSPGVHPRGGTRSIHELTEAVRRTYDYAEALIGCGDVQRRYVGTMKVL